MNDRRKYPDRPYVGVGAVIVQDGKVLLVKRKYEPLAGQWSLPGGAVEVGETLEACLVREMLEETGLDVSVGPVIEVFDRITHDDEGRVHVSLRARGLSVLADRRCAVRRAPTWPTPSLPIPAICLRYDLTAKATSVVERALVLDRQTPGSRP